jgi:hypothetical protein
MTKYLQISIKSKITKYLHFILLNYDIKWNDHPDLKITYYIINNNEPSKVLQSKYTLLLDLDSIDKKH